MNNKDKLSILLMEDDDVVRFSLRTYLEDCNYSVIEARDGKEGLEEYKKEIPGLILVDLRMPEIGGLEILAYVTKHSPDLPIIIISGAGAIGDVVESLRLGAWDFILKPVHDMAFLEHAIVKALERANLIKKNKEYQRDIEETLTKVREDEKAGLKIQMKLLPPKKSVIGPYTLSQYLMPSAYLSGDFVDYFKVNDDCVAFYVADVSGHGISSSLITVLLKSFMRKYVEKFHNRNDYSIFHPGTLLTKLNNELIRENVDKYVTVFYGLLICPDNSLRFSCAGQFPYPILWSKEKVDVIDITDKPVGLFPDIEFKDNEVKLPEEFCMAIFSDGILEVVNAPKIDDKIDFLKNLRPSVDFDDFIAKIKSKKKLPDDIAVLTIKKGECNEGRKNILRSA